MYSESNKDKRDSAFVIIKFTAFLDKTTITL